MPGDPPIISPPVEVVKSPNCGISELPIPFTPRLKIHSPILSQPFSTLKVRLARDDGSELYSKVELRSAVDPTELYARVDPAKKKKRESGASTSPDSDPQSLNTRLSSPVAFSPEPLSPTRALIQRFNEGQQRGLNEQGEGEVVYEEVGPRRPPVPLPRSRGGATSPDM